MINDTKLKSKLINITWPILIESILFSLLGGIDTIMIGRYSDSAVAAVGISNQLLWMINLMFGIITAGTTILLAQYIGAKSDKKNIVQLCGVSIGVNTIVGIIVSLGMLVGGKVLFGILNTPDELLPLGIQYMKIVGGFLFIQAIAMTFTAILRAHSLTKVCMNATIVMNIINVILNYLLIFGKFGLPEMGVAGAALGTTISKLIGTLLLAKPVYNLVMHKFKLSMFTPFPTNHLINILKIGIPSAAEQISYNLSQLAITSFINMISIESMAAKSYITTIICYTYIFSVAVGQGGSILIGQLVGKGENDKAYALCVYTLKRAMVVSVLISGGILLFGKPLFGLLTSNKEIISIIMTVLIIDFLLEPGRTVNIVGINALRAAGDVKFPVYIGIFSMWTFGVALAYFFGVYLGWGLPGIWLAFTLDEWFRGILVLRRWKNRSWEGRVFVEVKSNSFEEVV